jgi:hypothetical protein
MASGQLLHSMMLAIGQIRLYRFPARCETKLESRFSLLSEWNENERIAHPSSNCCSASAGTSASRSSILWRAGLRGTEGIFHWSVNGINIKRPAVKFVNRNIGRYQILHGPHSKLITIRLSNNIRTRFLKEFDHSRIKG